MLWTVANMPTTGVSHGQDNWSAITFSKPGMCLVLELCPESVATETDPLPAATGGGNGSHLVC